MCAAARNRKKMTKPLILGVQDHSRSSMLTLSSSPVTIIIRSMFVPVVGLPIKLILKL